MLKRQRYSLATSTDLHPSFSMSKKSKQKNPALDSNFLIIVSSTLAIAIMVGTLISSPRAVQPVKQEVLGEQAAPHIPTPELKPNATPPVVSAKSYYAIDLKTGNLLLIKNEEEPALPASTTKMATALVAMSYYHEGDVLTVGDIKVEGHKMGLVPGEQITVKNLLYGLLVFSGNDAAEVLAQNYPGGRENFVTSMNQLAKKLELKNTHFTNPVGLDEYLHFSSAKDLVKLAQYGMENPLFAQIVATKDYQITNVDGKIVHKVENTNELIEKMPGIIGVKTGWTENSGQDLVTLYEHNGHKVMLSVLGSSDRFGETKTILDWIFDNYQWK